VERDCLSRLDVVLTDSDDDQDRDEGADMNGKDFCVMGADKDGYGAVLLLGQHEPRTYNRKLPRADTLAAAVRTAKPTNHTCPVGFASAFDVPTTQTCVAGLGGKQPPPSMSPLGTARTTASADCAISPPTVAAHAAGRSCLHWPYEPRVMRVYWFCPTVRLNDGGRYPAPTSHIGARHSESTSVTTKPYRCVWFLAPHMVSHMISRCPHDQNGPCVPPPVKRHSAGHGRERLSVRRTHVVAAGRGGWWSHGTSRRGVACVRLWLTSDGLWLCCCAMNGNDGGELHRSSRGKRPAYGCHAATAVADGSALLLRATAVDVAAPAFGVVTFPNWRGGGWSSTAPYGAGVASL